jgi:hypothetical protein
MLNGKNLVLAVYSARRNNANDFFVAHRKIAGDPHRHVALPIKHLSPNILQVLLHIGKTTNRWK